MSSIDILARETEYMTLTPKSISSQSSTFASVIEETVIVLKMKHLTVLAQLNILS